MTHELYTAESLAKLNRTQLWAICESRGLKRFPKSSDCIQAILDAQPQPVAVGGDDDERGSGRSEVEVTFTETSALAEHEIIANIEYDGADFITQRWVVLVGGKEVHRANTVTKAQNWIAYHHKNGTLPVAKCEILENLNEIESHPSSLPAASKLWNLQPSGLLNIAICPHCNGQGCSACSYVGAKNIDSCKPIDDYRLSYCDTPSDSQVMYKAYNDTKFLGVVFRVRSSSQIWDNETDTYYWQIGDGVKYWSLREAIECLEKPEESTKMRELAEIERACIQHNLEVWEEGDVYDGDIKVGKVGCSEGQWWVLRANNNRKVVCNSASEAVSFLWARKKFSETQMQALIEESEGFNNKPHLLQVG